MQELNATNMLEFEDNKAVKGGDNIYGVSLTSSCKVYASKSHRNFSSQVWRDFFIFSTVSLSISLVSAQPTRVCLCDKNGHPQCTKKEYILLLNETAFPGEVLTLPIVLVGGDFGATVGTVYLMDSEYDQNRENFATSEHEFPVVQTKQCTVLKLALFNKSKFTTRHTIVLRSSKESNVLDLHKIDNHKNQQVQTILDRCDQLQEIDTDLRSLEILMRIQIDKCPLGFTLFEEYTQSEKRCDCYQNFK